MMNQTYERKPLGLNLKVMSEVLEATISLEKGGKEKTFTSTQKVAFLALWQRCDWVDGRFYDQETRRPYRVRWVRGYLQNKLSLSERGARFNLQALKDFGLLTVSEDIPRLEPNRFILAAEARSDGNGLPATDCRKQIAGNGLPATDCREAGNGLPGGRQQIAAYSNNQPNQPIETQVDHTARESIEERERRYAEAQRRQAEEERRREGERFGLPAGFLEKYYVKGDGR
jgi:hypothetical protein